MTKTRVFTEGGSSPGQRMSAIFSSLVIVAALVFAGGCSSQADASVLKPGVLDPKRSSDSVRYYGAPRMKLPKLTSEQAVQYSSAPWRLLAIHNSGSLDIEFAAGSSDCAHTVGQYVSETARTVQIAVLTKFTHSYGGCASSLLVRRSTIHLGTPLGSRKLFHAVVSSKWGNVQRQFTP